MKLKFTKGKWLPDIKKYDKAPKEIILGVKVQIKPNYYERLFDTILPETDKSYIEEHSKIEANVKLVCAAPELLKACMEVVKVGYGHAPSVGYMDSLIKKCELAINKATGK